MNFEFGIRKIQKVRYTYLLPIPPGWIKNMKLSKGDTLSIEMTADGFLEIKPSSAGPARSERAGSYTHLIGEMQE